MPEKKPESSKNRSKFTSDIQDFVRRRSANAEKKEAKPSGSRNYTKIQLLISEIDNELLSMSQSDPKVYTARETLTELKKLISRTFDQK